MANIAWQSGVTAASLLLSLGPGCGQSCPNGASVVVDRGLSESGACRRERTLSLEQSKAYFPLAIGDRWTYHGIRSDLSGQWPPSEFQQCLVVSDAKTVEGQTVFKVASFGNADPPGFAAGGELSLTDNGLIRHGSTSSSFGMETLVSGFPTYTEVRLPIETCSTIRQFEVATSSGAAASAAIEHALETKTVPVGTFAETLRLERIKVCTYAGSCESPELAYRADAVDWYASGWGRIARIVESGTNRYSYELMGAWIDGVGRGVVPQGTLSGEVPRSHDRTFHRPALAFDGTRYLAVLSTSTDAEHGSLHGLFVNRDGGKLGSFSIVDTAGVPGPPRLAFGDDRFLVVYPVAGALWGLLLFADGSPVAPPFTIDSEGTSPAVAYGAQSFMVAYVRADAIRLARISGHGQMLGTTIPYDGPAQATPAIASDGSQYLLVWRDNTTGSGHIVAGRVDGEGKALDVQARTVSWALGSEEDPDVAFDDEGYVVSWLFQSPQELNGQIRVARIDRDGNLLDGPPIPSGGRAVSFTNTPKEQPRITRFADQTLVVWQISPTEDTAKNRIVGTRIDGDGQPLDTSSSSEGLWLSSSYGSVAHPEVCWGGGSSLLVFFDGLDEIQDSPSVNHSVIYPW